MQKLFHDREIEKSDILDRLTYSNGDVVFLSGSLIEGNGNSKSDLDVFVLTKDIGHNIEYVYKTKYSKTVFFNINGIACDVEYWDYYFVESLINRISGINLSDYSTRTANILDSDEVDFLEAFSLIHRFLVGVSIYNREEYLKMKRQLNDENYFTILKRFHVNVIDNKYEDIIGNMDSKEYETAYILLNECIISVLCVYLLHKRVSIDREKWAYIKLRLLSNEDIEAKEVFNRFNTLYFLSQNDGDTLELLCKNFLRFINDIVRKCSL